MAIYLQSYKNTNTKSSTAGMYYYRVVNIDTVDLDGLAKHMASHNTPFSQGAIRGVLKDMCDCIKEIMLDGKKVKLGDLAIFSLGVHGRPSATEEELSPNTNIKTLSFRAMGTGQLSLRGTTLIDQATWKRYPNKTETTATTTE